MQCRNFRVSHLADIKQFLAVIVLSLPPFLVAQAAELGDLVVPKIQVLPIKDTLADRRYELYVKLPAEYTQNKDKSYPVIYFTDALWHVELLSAATEFLMEESILVGISWQKDLDDERAHVSRFRDYSVRVSSNAERQAKYQFGQASNHLAFIRRDVITTIESKYRTNPDDRTYFGYSAGGLFGAYALMTQPDTFKNYILGSPSLEGNMAYLSELGTKAASTDKGLNANVFVSYGALEKELGEHIEDFTRLLKTRSDKSLTLKQVVVEGSHQTAFPMTGVLSVTWLSRLASDKK